MAQGSMGSLHGHEYERKFRKGKSKKKQHPLQPLHFCVITVLSSEGLIMSISRDSSVFRSSAGQGVAMIFSEIGLPKK